MPQVRAALSGANLGLPFYRTQTGYPAHPPPIYNQRLPTRRNPFPCGWRVETYAVQAGIEVSAARRSNHGDCAAHARPVRGRKAPGAAGRHRLRQDLHHGQGHRGGQPSGAGPGAQQDAGRAALSRVQELLPAQRGRILRLLLRLLPAGGLHSGRRRLHREGSDRQRRARQAAAVGHQVAVRAPRLHHCRLGELHLRPGFAGSLLRHAAVPGEGPEDPPPGHHQQAGRDSLRAHRRRFPPRHLPRARRRHRSLSHLRRQRLPHRALGRRDRIAGADRSALRHRQAEVRPPAHLSQDALRDEAGDQELARSSPFCRSWPGGRPSWKSRAASSRRSASTSARASTWR